MQHPLSRCPLSSTPPTGCRWCHERLTQVSCRPHLETAVLHAPETFKRYSTLPASHAAMFDERLIWNSMLGQYLEGWAEADPAKIADATAQHYDFHDPLVGRFSRRTLPQYFALLRSRFSVAGVTRVQDLAFTLRGPMLGPSHGARRQYWREAPHL